MSVLTGSWQHEYIDTNGIKLHYVTQGSGELMLMLHGFPEFWYSWRHQIPEFAQNYKVVALDLRGYNDSDKPKERSAYVMDQFIKDIEGVIRGLGYDRAIIVGHDWGGAIAWNFAYSRPQMVERLIVINLPHPAKMAEGLRSPQQLLRSSYMFFFQLPEIPEALIQAGDYELLGRTLQQATVNKNVFTPADLEAYKDAASKRGALTAMLNYYRNLTHQRMLSSDWSILEVPTLLIWGEGDVALGKELTYNTYAYVRNLQIKYISNAGHFVHQEQPQLVNQYIRDFSVG
ncbi:alpha/beta fold hydrolase [Aliterella atlantica]|uniref:Epoxide hydrolase n=1 Tax=Aliterella atlantica CENA595 TaxID=1618023 RepID=A0A0D8ZVP0_9CYAN|nr:alpha/beta hydrolase [Aliterella atlantica]KJH72843.1 epoxide hydrolase [Aliterella atlantica CENA595]